MSIVCDNVAYAYALRRRETLTAFEGVSFQVQTGEFVSLVGPSGCGKSTVLKIIADLLRPTAGKVAVSAPDRDPNAPLVAMVFQQHGVFPWLTVMDNVLFGLQRHRLSSAEKHQRAQTYIDRVHLSGFEAAYPHQLSGGMQQRVNIARAFVSGAPILLMDEPFGSLDAQTRLILQSELLQIWQQERKTVLYVTHDIDEAVLLSHRVLVMSQRPGRIKAELTVPLDHPRQLTDSDHPLMRELRWRIWNLLEVPSLSTAD